MHIRVSFPYKHPQMEVEDPTIQFADNNSRIVFCSFTTCISLQPRPLMFVSVCLSAYPTKRSPMNMQEDDRCPRPQMVRFRYRRTHSTIKQPTTRTRSVVYFRDAQSCSQKRRDFDISHQADHIQTTACCSTVVCTPCTINRLNETQHVRTSSQQHWYNHGLQ